MLQMDSQQQRALSSPLTGVLHSSKSLGWSGIVVEQSYHAAGEYVYSPLPLHMICLHQDRSIPLEQVRDGHFLNDIIDRGQIQIIPAGAESTWRQQSGISHMQVLLTSEFLQQVAEASNQPHVELLHYFNVKDLRIESISLALLTELLEGGTTGRLYVEGLTTALAAHLVHTYTGTSHLLPRKTKGLPPSFFQRVTSLIEDRLTENLSLADLASEVDLSPSHFASLFRETTGFTPHHYVLQRRLERACSLLKTTRHSIGEIAAAVGFYDQSHLTRQMRRFMGITPTSLRHSHVDTN
ncbi:helix-turn-helix domain-containing protein [Ktedonospora formicarum]|uniref:HTH araC/xylS-type domain-containing protein n=1 Tax=Ktedonospora formicarum TaxID=2778364 RepID=A0A8J3IDT9_9CHLR|nr:AraC family transcriptional regulator [Ktedonospora formicarum]GHO50478.1 hypothetical protein KSX_86410 [Ktedonospora formicarum]